LEQGGAAGRNPAAPFALAAPAQAWAAPSSVTVTVLRALPGHGDDLRRIAENDVAGVFALDDRDCDIRFAQQGDERKCVRDTCARVRPEPADAGKSPPRFACCDAKARRPREVFVEPVDFRGNGVT